MVHSCPGCFSSHLLCCSISLNFHISLHFSLCSSCYWDSFQRYRRTKWGEPYSSCFLWTKWGKCKVVVVVAVAEFVAAAVAEPYYKSVHALALVYAKFASHTCCNTLESCHTHSLHSVPLILIANLATHIRSCKIGSGHLSDQWPHIQQDLSLANSERRRKG